MVVVAIRGWARAFARSSMQFCPVPARSSRTIRPATGTGARLSSDGAEQVEALAWARYLDPQSASIEQLPEAMKERAAKWSKEHEFFKPEPKQVGSRAI